MPTMSRNKCRSEHNREFVGSIEMILESLDRWDLPGFEDPIQWILGFRYHENFMKVMRTLYTSRFGSVYVNSATPDLIEQMIKELNPIIFKFYLVNGIDDSFPWQETTLSAGNTALSAADEHTEQNDIKSCSTDIVDDMAKIDNTGLEFDKIDIDDVYPNEQHPFVKAEKFSHEGFGVIADVPANTYGKQSCLRRASDVIKAMSDCDTDMKREINRVLEAYGYDNTLLMTDEHSNACDVLLASNRLTSKMKDTYDFSMKLLQPLQMRQPEFPIVIYTGPGGGKTHFNVHHLGNKALDSDAIFAWNGNRNKIMLTNIFELLLLGKKKIAILPSKMIFEKRCIFKKLTPGSNWYTDVKYFLKRNKIKFIYSNKFLTDVLYDHAGLLNEVLKLVTD